MVLQHRLAHSIVLVMFSVSSINVASDLATGAFIDVW